MRYMLVNQQDKQWTLFSLTLSTIVIRGLYLDVKVLSIPNAVVIPVHIYVFRFSLGNFVFLGININNGEQDEETSVQTS